MQAPYNYDQQSMINFCHFYAAPDMTHRYSLVMLDSGELEESEIVKANHYGANAGVKRANIHIFQNLEKNYALFRPIVERLLPEILQSYREYFNANEDKRVDYLVIPVIQEKIQIKKKIFGQLFRVPISEPHVVLLLVDINEEAPNCNFYDPKSKKRQIVALESVQTIKETMESFFDNAQIDNDWVGTLWFNTEYLKIQPLFDADNCGPYVASMIQDIACNQLIGTTAREKDFFDILGRNQLFWSVCQGSTLKVGMHLLDALKNGSIGQLNIEQDQGFGV